MRGAALTLHRQAVTKNRRWALLATQKTSERDPAFCLTRLNAERAACRPSGMNNLCSSRGSTPPPTQ